VNWDAFYKKRPGGGGLCEKGPVTQLRQKNAVIARRARRSQEERRHCEEGGEVKKSDVIARRAKPDAATS